MHLLLIFLPQPLDGCETCAACCSFSHFHVCHVPFDIIRAKGIYTVVLTSLSGSRRCLLQSSRVEAQSDAPPSPLVPKDLGVWTGSQNGCREIVRRLRQHCCGSMVLVSLRSCSPGCQDSDLLGKHGRSGVRRGLWEQPYGPIRILPRLNLWIRVQTLPSSSFCSSFYPQELLTNQVSRLRVVESF